MAYLICKKCNGYYKLQEGESPEDFENKCECSGNLQYSEYLELPIEESIKSEYPENEVIFPNKTSTVKIASKYKNYMLIGALITILSIFGAFLFILIVVLALPGLIIFNHGYKKYKRWSKGAEGERIVAEHLHELPKSYHIFHDASIPGMGGNIDHIVAGKTGLFLIETKNYSTHYIINGDKWTYETRNGQQIMKKNPGSQAKYGAKQLSDFLKTEGIEMPWINATVALINNNFTVKKWPEYYDIKLAYNLTDFILENDKNIDDQTLEDVANLIKPYSENHR